MVLATALRLLLWSQPLHQPANDEVEYITVARDLLAGRGWQFYEHYHWLRAPLYPLFLAGSLWLAGGDPSSGAALHRAALPNILLSIATVYLSFRLTLALVGGRVAASTGALLTTILWTLATFASLYMSETLFTFLFTAGLLCLVRPTNDQRPTTNDQRLGMMDDRQCVASSHPVTRSPGHPAPNPQPPTPNSRLSLRCVAAAGVLFGLATLTRSITLLFLPIVALWLFLQPTADRRRPTADGGRMTTDQRQSPSSVVVDSSSIVYRLSSIVRGPWSVVRGRLKVPAVFLLAAALTIAPWTIRNYRAYGRPILVETGLSYNLWAFNEPREEQDTIFRVLENIPNPADRSDYATAKGLAQLREDPMILVRKLWPGWIYLWRVKPIEDRFIQESYYGDVGLPIFTAAFALDDVLGLLIVLAGMAGLVLFATAAQEQPADRRIWRALLASLRTPKVLMALWMLYAISTMLLTHAETRYRHFLYPVLIPYAAWLLSLALPSSRRPRQIFDTRSQNHMPIRLGRPNMEQIFSIALLWTLIGAVWVGYYSRDWAAQGFARGWHALASEVAWAAGARDLALREDERALAAHKTPDGWIRLGDHARAMGDVQRALKAYRSAVAQAPPYTRAVARLGDLLRERGDAKAARGAFVGDYVDQQQLVDVSWRELRSEPPAALAIGDGLDFGYVDGVYIAEKQQGQYVRWTNGHMLLRLRPPGQSRAALLRLRLAAPRPDGSPVSAQVCVSGRCTQLALDQSWRVYEIPLELAAADPAQVDIRSDIFDAPEGRRLGVLIDAASLVPLAGQ